MLHGGKLALKKREDERDAAATKLEKIDRAKPRIMLREPGAVYFEPIDRTFSGIPGMVIKRRTDIFLKVNFINNPEVCVPNAKATVLATIDYYRRPDDVHVLSLDGRWSDSTQPSGMSPLESKVPLLSTTFSQGQQHSLDIAFCNGETGEYFAWNNDNYRAINEFFVYPKHLLVGDRFKVVIRLRGDWVDETFSFVFSTGNKSFTIER